MFWRHEDTKKNGHVTRNIRLSLVTLDYAEPYVQVLSVSKKDVVDWDAVPGLGSSKGRNAVEVTGEVVVEYKLWGCERVDEAVALILPGEEVKEDAKFWKVEGKGGGKYDVIDGGGEVRFGDVEGVHNGEVRRSRFR